MRSLGVAWERKEAIRIEVQGRGPSLTAPSQPLDCGNSGSTMRMLSGIVAGQKFCSEMIGDESLSRRPMERVITPLTAMGAQIASQAGKPPLRITGGCPESHRLHHARGQRAGEILPALCRIFADGETRIEEPLRTRDHGEVALRAFGASSSARAPDRACDGQCGGK